MKDLAWHEQRRTGIGGSDIAAILGLSPWSTALEVWQEKRGELSPQPENNAMRWGLYLEPVIRQAYSDETGRSVMVPTEMLRHGEFKFMTANVDGFTNDQRGFEAKTARTAQGWGEAGSDEIPQSYYLQVQHYMVVTALPVFDVAVLIGGSDFRIFTVEADKELMEMVIAAEREFWQAVQNNEPPEPVSYRDVIARWGHASRTSLAIATEPVMAALATIRALRRQKEVMEEAEEEAKTVVLKHMNEADMLVDGTTGEILATWKMPAAPRRFDSAAFKVAQPELYDKFVREFEASRRFLLKG